MNIMTKEEAKKQIEQWQTLLKGCYENVDNCKSKIDKLQAIIDKPDRWQDGLVQPEKEEYFYLASNKYEGLDVHCYSEFNRRPEHAFRTKEQAELIKEKMLLMQEMHAFVHVRNGDWVADWDDSSQRKYGIILNENKAHADHYIRMNCLVFGVAVKSKAIAEEMLEIFGERIEKFYNKQY